MTRKFSRTTDKKPSLPGGKLPDHLVWPVLAVIPLACLVGAWTTPAVATPDELKAAVSQVLLTTLLLVMFWCLPRKGEIMLRFSPPTWAFAALFGLATVSLAWSVNPDFWFYKWSRWYAGFVMFLFGMQLRQSTLNLDRVFLACMAGGVFTAAVGSAQQLFNFAMIPQTAFPASTFGNGNVAGEVMIFTFLLGCYFLCKPELSPRATWACVAAMTLIAMYTFYTRTRAVWLAVLLETALFAVFVLFDRKRGEWLHWNRQKTIASVAGLLVLLVMINFRHTGFQPFWQVAAFEMGSIANEIGSTEGPQASARYLIWSSTLNIIADSPLIGTGLGSFFHMINVSAYSNMQVLGVQRVHNDLLEVLVDMGVAGLLCILAIIVTFCRQLYLLLCHASGKHRLVYVLLTIAVTGSMLDAMLAFPYEMPVPLLLMPLFMAIVIRGAEQVAPAQVKQVRAGQWYRPATLAATAVMLVVVTLVNGQWLQDFRQLNRVLEEPERNLSWQPDSVIYSQAHITAARGVVDALAAANLDALAIRVFMPAVAYWPDSIANTLAMTRFTHSTGQLLEAEKWGLKSMAVQPPGTYVSETFLITIYSQLGDFAKVVDIYNRLKDLPEHQLTGSSNILNALHYNSIALQDSDNTQRFYDLYVKYFGHVAGIEANHAIFLINLGQVAEAMPYMARAVAMDATIPQAAEFNRLLFEAGAYNGQ